MKTKITDAIRVIVIIAIIIGAIWFAILVLENLFESKENTRNEYFKNALEDCEEIAIPDYRGRCESIFEELRSDLFNY